MWIPSLYLAEGLPYVAVMTVSVIMYKRMGVSNTDIALYTSWLYLPWVIKPFWSPFVDILKTKRWWIVVMQLLTGAAFAGIALTIPVPLFFQATLAFFWLLAFSSATHDIAADGFYMLALDTNSQAKFVGIRSTFYRVATIFGQGILIIIAGAIESATGMEPVKITVEASPHCLEQQIVRPEMYGMMSQYDGDMRFVTSANQVTIATDSVHKDSVRLFLETIDKHNQKNNFYQKEDKTAVGTQSSGESRWTTNVSRPLGKWIKARFGEEREVVEMDYAGNVGVTAVWLSRCPERGETFVLNTSPDRGDASISIVKGERLTFDATNWNKPAYIAFQLDAKLATVSSAEFKGLSGNNRLAWTIAFVVLAALFVMFGLFHRVVLPKPDADRRALSVTVKGIVKDFGGAFVSFFRKADASRAVFFMLTYRFSEAQALKLVNPFLLDARNAGGLGLTTRQVGVAYGTVGIVALTLGGITGGYAAARGGLKKWLWPMSLSVLMLTAVFVFLSYTQTENFFIINACIFIEQLGYGFGFTAYMLYLIYFSEGEQKTSHYAICTGFMALGMMIPGMFAGWLQELIGYTNFFIWVMICTIVPLTAVALLKIDTNFGKKG